MNRTVRRPWVPPGAQAGPDTFEAKSRLRTGASNVPKNLTGGDGSWSGRIILVDASQNRLHAVKNSHAIHEFRA